MASAHYALFKELEMVTCRELESSERLIQLMVEKVNLLNPNDFADERCERIARLFISLLKDVLSERYQDISIRGFAHVCVALDYFLDPHETIPDALPDGFDDDLALLLRTESRFKREIDHYRAWRLRIGEPISI